MRLDGDQVTADPDDGDAGHFSRTYMRGLEAWVEHPRRYLSRVRLVRVQLPADHDSVDVLSAVIETLDSQLAEVQVLSLEGLLLFDSALNLSVVWSAPRDQGRTRGREGTRLSNRQHSLLNVAWAVHQPYPTQDDR
jgi:hypothetical protein